MFKDLVFGRFFFAIFFLITLEETCIRDERLINRYRVFIRAFTLTSVLIEGEA